jgi:effector-binding domain-containing protein
MNKRLAYIILLLLVGTGIWYVFIKKYDYQVSFEAKHAPGIVYQKLLNWNQGRATKEVYTILNKTPFSEVELELNQDSLKTLMKWEFYSISDSVTKVKIHFKDQENSISERLKFLVGQSGFVKNSIKTAKKVRTELIAHNTRYRVNTPEIAIMPERRCACTKTDSIKMLLKANNMMRENEKLAYFLVRNGLSVTDFPLLKVTRWDQDKEEIDIEFCFPVPKDKDDYLPIDGVYLKSFPKQKALKTIFNGNYLISDRAWYKAVDYAERNQIDIEPNPIEFYYDDPHSGTNELSWKAEIFFPIIDNNQRN